MLESPEESARYSFDELAEMLASMFPDVSRREVENLVRIQCGCSLDGAWEWAQSAAHEWILSKVGGGRYRIRKVPMKRLRKGEEKMQDSYGLQMVERMHLPQDIISETPGVNATGHFIPPGSHGGKNP